ncbi:putative tRNA (guanine-N(7)-)-methyltransferase [Leptospira fainei serovar Hurstbridge str. BUT 6]|uniref:tRNA (guanine-N(7)-)-methyltransferase n=1 Tax=Leptospira fainei serovar Hurstbridge str. BUT 6 TaxID=1193011 RepID=S3UTS1_9LEPT|nr:methyltransferase domain-containing protein [Leptospira fainei]EPG73826.1 putative tRNA (guanine-N(7)-)-methyltransferase [Leptospira fainei serovar Hurstbridge str. BUT 6]
MTMDFRKKLWNIAGGIPFESDYFLRIDAESKLKKSDLFPNTFGTYYLELGSGWGEVAIELAKANPNTGFVLMEKKLDRIRKTIRSASKFELDNVRILSVNFNWFLEDIFEEGCFDEILLNFPDPWPKKRHHKHRTLSPRFLDSLNALLPSHGKFHFATDYGPYARKAISFFRNDSRFKTIGPEYSLSRSEFPISYFEKTKREEGSRIYYLDRERI